MIKFTVKSTGAKTQAVPLWRGFGECGNRFPVEEQCYISLTFIPSCEKFQQGHFL